MGQGFFCGEKWSLNLREKANNFEIPRGFQISKFKLHLYAFEKICCLLFIPYIFLRFVSPSGCGSSVAAVINLRVKSDAVKFPLLFFFDVSHT